MPDCGDTAWEIIAFYARSRMKRSLSWFLQLGIDDRFTNADHESGLLIYVLSFLLFGHIITLGPHVGKTPYIIPD